MKTFIDPNIFWKAIKSSGDVPPPTIPEFILPTKVKLGVNKA